MPKMADSDLADALKFEARECPPFPVEQAVLDYQLLSPRPGQPEEKARLLLIAAPSELVEQV